MKRTIVIVHPGSLGDVLLAVPAIRRLRQRFPGHAVVLIARAEVSRFLSECRVIDDWLSLEEQAAAGIFSGRRFIPSELQSWLGQCDLAVAWLEDKDGALGVLFQDMGVARVHIQSPFSPRLHARHQCDRLLEVLGETVGETPLEGTVRVPSHLLVQGQDILDAMRISRDQPLVLVHPGSGSTHKCLEPRQMALLIERFQQAEMRPFVLEGPADQDAVEQALRVMNQPPLVLRDLSLSQLAGVLAQITLYIGHDSGVTHLSALLGIRTIAVFGPTDHHRWAPQGSHVTILRGGPCTCETWEAVKMCPEKPCLHVPIEEILAASGTCVREE